MSIMQLKWYTKFDSGSCDDFQEHKAQKEGWVFCSYISATYSLSLFLAPAVIVFLLFYSVLGLW